MAQPEPPGYPFVPSSFPCRNMQPFETLTIVIRLKEENF